MRKPLESYRLVFIFRRDEIPIEIKVKATARPVPARARMRQSRGVDCDVVCCA